MKTEKQKYLEWLEDQIQNHGLQGVHVSRSDCLDVVLSALGSGDINVIQEYKNSPIENEEEYYAELNRMIAAPRLEDCELFPNGTTFTSDL